MKQMFEVILSFALMIPLPFIILWVFIVAHKKTDELEGYLSGCWWLMQTKDFYKNFGLPGKVMRCLFIFLTCLTPDLAERRGLAIKSELTSIPDNLRITLYWPYALFLIWGALFIFFGLLLKFGLYTFEM